VGIKDRVKKLEEKAWGGPERPCEECGGAIILEEIQPDGSVHYPDREPCPVCGSHGSEGRIGRIVVDAREQKGGTKDEVHEVMWP
jgi:hypothetical protein